MRKISTFVLVVLPFLFCFSSSSLAQDRTIVDDILQVPKTTIVPEIDGQMDAIWDLTTAHPLLKFESGSTDTAESFNNHFSTFRLMWDDENFYVFVKVVDDTLLVTPTADPWTNDCIELFFDGDNRKLFEAQDSNDIQMRWVYGETPDNSPQGDGRGNFAFLETAYGFNFELAMPQDSLIKVVGTGDTAVTYPLFELVADHEIGFEISNADRDNDAQGRTHVIHWWTNDGNTWQYAHLYGTAILSANEIDEVAKVQYTDIAPVIDGVFDETEGWAVANELTLEKLEGAPEPSPDTIMSNWGDHRASYWSMWDDENLYLFVKVIDDTILVNPTADPWTNDCIELFFDGDNRKLFEDQDSNDIQMRWVYGETPDNSPQGDGRGDWVFLETEEGFNFELVMAQDSLIKVVGTGDTAQTYTLFNLVDDHEFGFEISNADRDNDAEGRSHVLHWWTNDGNTWQYAHLYGTSILFGGSNDVDGEGNMPGGYELNQNYPNPFNPTTNITFTLLKSEKVNLTVYNILGMKVATLIDGVRNAGENVVTFNAVNLPSGVYFYKLETESSTLTKKMMLLK